MPSAYVIVNSTVTNPARYEDYKKLSTAAMQAYGAEICIRGGAIEVAEGDWVPDRLVLLSVLAVCKLLVLPDLSPCLGSRGSMLFNREARAVFRATTGLHKLLKR